MNRDKFLFKMYTWSFCKKLLKHVLLYTLTIHQQLSIIYGKNSLQIA